MHRAAVFLGLIGVAACGGDVPHDYSSWPQEEGASLQQSEDATLDSSSEAKLQMRSVVYGVTRDRRRCASPWCGGWWITALNRSSTTCADGTSAPECYVARIDFHELGLSPMQTEEVRQRADKGEIRLAGHQTTEGFDVGEKFGVLRPHKAWGVATDVPARGTTFEVADRGFVCVAAPCFNVRASAVNSAKFEDVSTIDLSAAKASQEQLAEAKRAVEVGDLLTDGVIRGDLSSKATRPSGRTLVASQFYLPYRATDLCDGAICPAVDLQCPKGTHADYSYPNCCGVCVPSDSCMGDQDCDDGLICSTSLGDCQLPPGCEEGKACITVCTGVCREPEKY